jgi:hypothetical protein
MIRGKYTFVTSDWYDTSEGEERLMTPLMIFHASIPLKLKTKYGMPPVGRRATLPKMSVKIPAPISG